ncbi:hypothetical protein OJAV_G00135390 [Oryzias javanicus]|uniref:Uncharacterized protein n=1 Tax=Oryzias javanicus TaxID=123683 RepID=A0A437CKQ0_ORYJA|nr:hypothetical protein OJAV_G00135390 [Oryzias javanicus]
MQQRRNGRGFWENYVEGNHLKLPELKEAAREINLVNNYIYRDDIPEYPRPQFQVSFLKHDTTAEGLKGIRQDRGFRDLCGGFRDPHERSLVWWSLSVRDEDMEAAEKKLMEEEYSGMNGQINLARFATSPAFSPKSRLGHFRFTFPLEEVLKAYSQQFCSGGQPVMQVYKTVLYKQEIMYAVLVHSPDDQEDSTEDPNAVCFFRDGRFLWRSEAMCGTHRYKLNKNNNSLGVEEIPPYPPKYYVWDNVAIAFDVGEEVLEFNVDQLRQNLKYCELDSVTYNFTDKLTAEQAEELIRDLWPESPVENLPRHTGDGDAPPPERPS